jgi:hypothetical protein
MSGDERNRRDAFSAELARLPQELDMSGDNRHGPDENYCYCKSCQEVETEANVAEVARLRRMNDALSAQMSAAEDERDTLATRLAQVETERDAMRAVVEAAVAWVAGRERGTTDWRTLVDGLHIAVARYQATGTTTEEGG